MDIKNSIEGVVYFVTGSEVDWVEKKDCRR